MIKAHDSIIVQKITRLLIAPIQIFALYVFFHGHYSPGGGFQAGVLIGAAFILQLLVGTHQEVTSFSVRNEFRLATIGIGIYAILGALSLLFQSEFLNYGALSFLAEEEARRRYYGILIAELGVAFVVSMTIVVIFHILAFFPKAGADRP